MRLSVLALACLLVVGACSTGGSSSTTTSTLAESTTTTSVAPPSTTTPTTIPSSTSTTGRDTTTTTTREIDVFIEGGQVVGPDRFDYQLDEEVSIWILSDVADEVHVHGYDLFFLVKPGIPAELRFVAGIPGIFEVELESTHLLLFELQVSP